MTLHGEAEGERDDKLKNNPARLYANDPTMLPALPLREAEQAHGECGRLGCRVEDGTLILEVEMSCFIKRFMIRGENLLAGEIMGNIMPDGLMLLPAGRVEHGSAATTAERDKAGMRIDKIDKGEDGRVNTPLPALIHPREDALLVAFKREGHTRARRTLLS